MLYTDRPYSFKTRFFLRKNIVAVLFFRAGLYTFPSSKYKTSTLSKFTQAGQNANIVFNVSDQFTY